MLEIPPVPPKFVGFAFQAMKAKIEILLVNGQNGFLGIVPQEIGTMRLKQNLGRLIALVKKRFLLR